ncbi:MAG: aryl-sulfate sulfotransferase [Gammaproteobacteria bacterium]|nr:aryl-sulfate sulfotransferase [Gammaproteobacteria bacterium]
MRKITHAFVYCMTLFLLVACGSGSGGSGATVSGVDFISGQTSVAVGDSVSFTDLSTNNPISWSWVFDGGTPSVSTEQNPTVTYSTVGVYDVVLTVSTADGDYVETKTGYISVTASDSVYGGYMLLAPLQSNTTYLVDTDESVVKTWTSAYQPGNSAYLEEDGTLLRTGRVMNGNRFMSTGGAGGVVEKINWDSSVSWSYQKAGDNECLHHDVEALPNGNILMIAWEYKTSVEAEDAGRNPGLLADGELWPDKIIEINPVDNTVVWEWHVWDHLVQDYSNLKSNYGVVAEHPELIDLNYVDIPGGIADWTHINSIDYNAEFDQIIVSTHGFDEFWVIDHSTTTAEAASHSGGAYGKGGDLLYRWGNPAAYGASGTHYFYGQHDAQWIPTGSPGAGNVLVFNNGQGRPEGNYSSIEEIVPDIDIDGSYPVTIGQAFSPSTPLWTYQETVPTDFYGSNISGVQRLENGNTLICNGPDGYIFEVTNDGSVVWSYQNTDGVPVFRVIKYPYTYSGFSQL